jgi:uncharacterized protein involved in exopolysaccharide biosynthesis
MSEPQNREMNEKTTQDPGDRELSLAEILRIVLENKFRIGAFSLAVGVLTALYSLSVPNVYRSTSALVIRIPEIQLTGEAAPLEPEMLVALTNSTEVKRAVFEIASASGYVEEEAEFRRFQQTLETSVQTRRGPNRDLIPMIELNASATDPVRAKDVANLWAQVAVQKSKEIYSRGIVEQSDFVGGFFNALESARTAAEATYATKTLEANLDLKNASLTTQLEAEQQLDKELFEMRLKFESNKATIQELRRRLTGQEVKDMWVGDYVEQTLMSGGEVQSASISPRSATLADTVRRMVQKRKQFYDFLQESAYFGRRNELQNWIKQMGLVVQELSAASRELVVKENRYEALSVEAATLTPTFTLSKAITDDPMWEEYLKRGDSGPSDFPMLRSEYENPNYYTFQRERIQLSADVSTLRQQIRYLRRREVSLSERVGEASAELAQIERQKEIWESGFNRDRTLLEIMKEDYKKESADLQNMEIEQVQLENGIRLKAQNLVGIETGRGQLARLVFASSQELEALERDLDNMETIAETLATQSAEVQLLKESVQMGARAGGTTILYQAEANPQRVGPRRTRTVLLAMAAAALLFSVYYVGKRLVQPA